MDGERNAQIETMKKVFLFDEVPGLGTGTQAVIDPDHESSKEGHAQPFVVTSAMDTVGTSQVPSQSEPSVNSRVSKLKAKVSDDVAIGIGPGRRTGDFRLLAIYQKRELKK